MWRDGIPGKVDLDDAVDDIRPCESRETGGPQDAANAGEGGEGNEGIV